MLSRHDPAHRVSPAALFSMRSVNPCVRSDGLSAAPSSILSLLTYAEPLQYDGYLRQQETNEAILELSKQGLPIKQIVKRTGHSRKLVRGVLRGQRCDVFRVRQNSLEEWLPWLDSRWGQGARNASALEAKWARSLHARYSAGSATTCTAGNPMPSGSPWPCSHGNELAPLSKHVLARVAIWRGVHWHDDPAEAHDCCPRCPDLWLVPFVAHNL